MWNLSHLGREPWDLMNPPVHHSRNTWKLQKQKRAKSRTDCSYFMLNLIRMYNGEFITELEINIFLKQLIRILFICSQRLTQASDENTWLFWKLISQSWKQLLKILKEKKSSIVGCLLDPMTSKSNFIITKDNLFYWKLD